MTNLTVRKVAVGVSAFVGSLFGQLITKPVILKEESFLDNHLERKEDNMIHRVIKIVGVTFNNDDGESRQDIISKLKGTERVYLVFESDNPKSKDAVSVFIGGKMVGRLARKDASEDVDSTEKIIRDKIRKNKNFRINGFKVVGGKPEYPRLGVELFIQNER